MEKPFLTIHEAAQQIGVTPLTLRNWHKRGILIPIRNPYNNYRLYKREDIDRFLKEIASGATPTLLGTAKSVPNTRGNQKPRSHPTPSTTGSVPRIQKLVVRFETLDDGNDMNATMSEIQEDKNITAYIREV